MDSAWNFRHAYDEARKIKEKQDAFCDKLDKGLWDQVDAFEFGSASGEGEGLRGAFPESLQWEALVDVLRGRVKVGLVSGFRRFNAELSILCST